MASMTAAMLVALEETLLKEKPDMVLLYGDTNTTLAGALAAAKIHIPIAHVEAGYRTRSLTNPEEVNRVCADHVSSLLFAVTQQCLANLREEGLEDRSQFVGDPMYDAFVRAREKACGMSHELVCFDGSVRDIPGDYYYLTCHREENTADDNALREVLAAMDELDAPTVYPVHPRNRERVLRLCGQRPYENVVFCDPVGYYTSIALVLGARKVVTDSGGLQREAFFGAEEVRDGASFRGDPGNHGVWAQYLGGAAAGFHPGSSFCRAAYRSRVSAFWRRACGEPRGVQPACVRWLGARSRRFVGRPSCLWRSTRRRRLFCAILHSVDSKAWGCCGLC